VYDHVELWLRRSFLNEFGRMHLIFVRDDPLDSSDCGIDELLLAIVPTAGTTAPWPFRSSARDTTE
jgi:hypothetical protein